MGGSGISGDVIAVGVQRRAARARHRAEAVPRAGVRRTADARVRGVLLGRHRGDGVDGHRGGRMRRANSSRSRAVASSSELAHEYRGLHLRCPDGYLPRAAIGALVAPLAVTLFRSGLAPSAHAQLVRAQEQLGRPPRRVPAQDRGRGEPGARDRAPDRAHDPAHVRRRRARRGRGVPLEVRRQREREGARVLAHVSRSSTTTRSARGVSTAT